MVLAPDLSVPSCIYITHYTIPTKFDCNAVVLFVCSVHSQGNSNSLCVDFDEIFTIDSCWPQKKVVRFEPITPPARGPPKEKIFL